MSGESAFGERLRAARLAAGLTQEELADRSGIATRTISDLERGVNDMPRASTARLLADALGLAGDGRERFLARRRPGAAVEADSGSALVFRRVLVPPTALIGREQTTAQVVALLAEPEVRLVTLSGPGGVGKTRLAAQVAAEWLASAAASSFAASVTSSAAAAQVVDVDLATVGDEGGLLREVAGALGDSDRGTGVDGIVELIGERRLLLVLDNFEQLVEAAPVLSRVLARSRRLTVLVTSRLPLRIRGEHEVQVPPLEVADAAADPAAIAGSAAVRMFASCARQRRADWRVDAENAGTVAAVCRAVDGMPLAIELAASHIGTLDVAEIARRLAKSAQLLSSGPRDLPARQQTLTATIGWSYDLLGPAARTLLRRLAVFPAWFSAVDAEEVCGSAAEAQPRDRSKKSGAAGADSAPRSDEEDPLPTGAVIAALTALVDAGLVREVTAPGGVRYQLYQTVREYAADLLADSGEAAAVTTAHAEYLLRLTGPAVEQLDGPDQVRLLDELDLYRPDITFAFEHLLAIGRRVDALRLGGAVWRYWQQRGHIREGYQLLDAALGGAVGGALPDGLDQDGYAVWARAMIAAASLHYLLGGRDDVRDRYRQAASLWERAGSRPGQTAALSNLAMYEHYSGDRRAAKVVYEQSLAAARDLGADRQIGTILQNYGTLLVQEGELTAAEEALAEALARFRNVGMVHGEANVQGTRADLALAAGHPDRAEELAIAASRLFEELGDQRSGYEITRQFGDIAAARGNDAAAFDLFATAIRGFRTVEDRWGISDSLRRQARAALRLGRLAEAGSLAREARALSAQIGEIDGAEAADGIIAEAGGPS
jgi:predicted ATPase/transcriptional regulator with XRE-family HTH domain